MKSFPLVSVIVPLYNAAEYILETIDCLLNQTYQNIEIIVIDDFSSDNSFQLVSSIQSDRIILKKNKKKGACAARNYGFELSKGEFIQFLDADDLLSKNKIEAQFKLIKDIPNAIATCGWGKFTNYNDKVVVKNQLINKNYSTPYLWLIDAWQNIEMAPTIVWFAPRNVLIKAGGWNEQLLKNQDGEFFCRVILNSSCIKYSNEAVAYYRTNPNGITHSKITFEKLASQLQSYQLYEKHLSSKFKDFKTRKAIGNLYLKFIYHQFGTHPLLVGKAWEYFYNLNVGKPWGIGGEILQLLTRLMGFKAALKIKHFFKLRWLLLNT